MFAVAGEPGLFPEKCVPISLAPTKRQRAGVVPGELRRILRQKCAPHSLSKMRENAPRPVEERIFFLI